MDTMLNIDQLAAQYSQQMLSNADNKKTAETLTRLVTKTLGVLQEQGVYAMMLFLFSRTGDEDKIAPLIHGALIAVLNKLPAFSNNIIPNRDAPAKEILEFFSSNHIIKDIDTLFLVRDLYEQTLIYARYGAKAAAKTEKKLRKTEENP